MDTKHARIWLAIGLAAVLHAGVASAKVFERKPSEADTDFMVRVLGPSAELAQDVIRSTELAGGKLTLIGFVTVWDKSKDHTKGDVLVGHLLIETSPNHFEHVKFTSCEEEGGTPELMAVFFARTVKDGGRDLAVLCKWEQQHAVAQGTSYGAEFYRLKVEESKFVVEPLTDLDKKFETDDLVVEDEHGKWVSSPKPKFKTVAEIKKLLTKMGLKQ